MSPCEFVVDVHYVAVSVCHGFTLLLCRCVIVPAYVHHGDLIQCRQLCLLTN